MALSLDDKLLGEKVENYCSSSEDEDGHDSDEDSEHKEPGQKMPQFIPEAKLSDYAGSSTNTGPKGVINDWREFKRLETERREEHEKERKQLMSKLQLTCRSHLNDEEEKKKDEEFLQQLEQLDDEFLKQYRQKRIEEMRRALDDAPKFGKVQQLDKTSFIDAIDNEKYNVKVIIHVYENNVEACAAMDGCLKCLAQDYMNIKFCRIKATDAKLSKKFSSSGVPALLVYKGGELIGNFIRLGDEFGEDFFASDVESFLHEHGMLPVLENSCIRDQNTGELRAVLPQDDEFYID